MAVKNPHIKSMKHEDFKDNEYIEKLVDELNSTGANVVVGMFDELINWGARKLAVASLLRHVMLRYRIHVPRRCPLRHGSIRFRGGS